jgi:hypothetical protein
MSMRVIKIVTRLRAEDAHTLIEFLDDVRDTLMQTYGAEIRAMLREATTTRESGGAEEDEEPF